MRRLIAILLMLVCLCVSEAQTSQQKAHQDMARDYKASLQATPRSPFLLRAKSG